MSRNLTILVGIALASLALVGCSKNITGPTASQQTVRAMTPAVKMVAFPNMDANDPVATEEPLVGAPHGGPKKIDDGGLEAEAEVAARNLEEKNDLEIQNDRQKRDADDPKTENENEIVKGAVYGGPKKIDVDDGGLEAAASVAKRNLEQTECPIQIELPKWMQKVDENDPVTDTETVKGTGNGGPKKIDN